MNFVYEKVGEGRGRPSKFAVLEDGSKVLYTEWIKTQPKGKRGRKAYQRDENGNVIRPEKKTVDIYNLPPPPSFVQQLPVEPEYSEPEVSFDAVEAMSDEEFAEYCENTGKDDMSDEEFAQFIKSVKDEMGVQDNYNVFW
jgi:hypothetical protein